MCVYSNAMFCVYVLDLVGFQSEHSKLMSIEYYIRKNTAKHATDSLAFFVFPHLINYEICGGKMRFCETVARHMCRL